MTIIMMSDDSSQLSSSNTTTTASPPSLQTFQYQSSSSPPSMRSNSLSTLIGGDSDSLDDSSTTNVNNNNSSSNSNSNNNKNVPYVNFYCRSNTNSEIIEERVIYLDKPCKIGRSVAKIKPEVNNAIFDCKVLSRNHALLWYENSKFYLQDTKSSNGTFLNGNRLGKSNEDSPPYDLNSGDIIQFGVDVTENTKKVTHGCITVEIKLFHPSGVEAKNPTKTNKIDIQAQELYQLALYLQEALMREQVLQDKITRLQNIIQHAQEISENGWLALIDEDRLLSRIDYLEKQLTLYSSKLNRNDPSQVSVEDGLKQTITKLREDIFEVENSAKLSIEKAIQEKAEAMLKTDELKIVLSSSEDECKNLRQIYEDSKKELLDLANKYQDLLSEIDDLQQNLADTKLKLMEKSEQLDFDKQKYEEQIQFLRDNEKALSAQIESLLAEKDFQKQQLEGMISRSQQQKPSEHKETETEESIAAESDKVNELSVKIASLEKQLQEYEESHQESVTPTKEIKAEEEEEEAEEETVTKSIVNCKNSNNDDNNESITTTTTNSDDHVNNKSTDRLLDDLKIEIEYLKKKLIDYENEGKITREQLKYFNDENNLLKEQLTNSDNIENKLKQQQKQIENLNEMNKHLKEDYETLQTILWQERRLLRDKIVQINAFKNGRTEDTNKLMDEIKRKDEKINELEETLNALETRLNDNNKLVVENSNSSKLNLIDNCNNTTTTKPQIIVNTKRDISINDQLDSSTHNHKENLIKLGQEHQQQSSANEHSNDYIILKDECSQLKIRIQAIEDEMKKTRLENSQLSNDYSHLQESYQQLRELKESLENKESQIQLNLTDAQKEADQNRDKLKQAQYRIKELEKKCDDYESNLYNLNNDLNYLHTEYDGLSMRTKVVSYFSMIPLSLFLMAIMIAFYPTLATITATSF